MYLSYMSVSPHATSSLRGTGEKTERKEQKTFPGFPTSAVLYWPERDRRGMRAGRQGKQAGREGGRERRGVEHFISLSSLSPSQAFNAPFSACPALCKIMLIPLPVLSHLYKPPFLPLKSNYISLRSCQKTGLACEY